MTAKAAILPTRIRRLDLEQEQRVNQAESQAKLCDPADMRVKLRCNI